GPPMDGGRPLATLTPMGAGIDTRRADITPATRVRLSRFAYSRRDGDELVLESPLAPARVTLHGTTGAAAFATLTRPVTPAEVAAALPELDVETACALVQLL